MTMNHGRYKVKVEITGKDINDTVTMDYYPTEDMTVKQVAEKFDYWNAKCSKVISVTRAA
jgi:hypothetical protein